MQRLVEKNKYGSYTWIIDIPPEYKLYLNGTSDGNFIVQLKKLSWLNHKTVDSYSSDLRFEYLIRFAINKTREYFLNSKLGSWSIEKSEEFIEQTVTQYKLSKYFSAYDRIDEGGCVIVDKPGIYNLELLSIPEIKPWGKYQVHYKAKTPNHFSKDKDDEDIQHPNLIFEFWPFQIQIDDLDLYYCIVDFYTSSKTGEKILGIIGLEE